MSGIADFRKHLARTLSGAGSSAIEVNARQLHDIVLGPASSKNEMPTCCSAMWQEFSQDAGDTVVAAPPSGKGGTLTLRYVLPRPISARRGMPASFSLRTPTIKRLPVPSSDDSSVFANVRTLLSDRERVADSVELFRKLKGDSLRATISRIQRDVASKGRGELQPVMNGVPLGAGLAASLLVKAASAQVNEVVHALSILLCIPKILDDGELVEAVSLAAGNTGTPYDLETNKRVAEFKIIDWKGADSVREAQLFKDYFTLAEAQTPKKKYLYVTGRDWAMKALARTRDCKGALKPKLAQLLTSKYPEVSTFAQYFQEKRDEVAIVGLDGLLLGEIALG